MSAPTPYVVRYTPAVLRRLLELSDEARARGQGSAYYAALKDFHRRLQIYPQFGDPLSDLKAQVGHIRLGLIPPLSMRYGVFEERREVMVAALPVLLARRAE